MLDSAEYRCQYPSDSSALQRPQTLNPKAYTPKSLSLKLFKSSLTPVVACRLRESSALLKYSALLFSVWPRSSRILEAPFPRCGNSRAGYQLLSTHLCIASGTLCKDKDIAVPSQGTPQTEPGTFQNREALCPTCSQSSAPKAFCAARKTKLALPSPSALSASCLLCVQARRRHRTVASGPDIDTEPESAGTSSVSATWLA